MMLEITDHAHKRACQRNFSYDDLLFIVQNGNRTHNAGAIFYTLLNKNIPRTYRSQEAICKLEGTVVVVCRCNQVIMTVYRARDLRRNRRKSKYSKSHAQRQQCPFCMEQHDVA